MNHIRPIFLTFVVLLVAVAGSAEANPQPLTWENIFLRSFGARDATISPDGKWVAVTAATEKGTGIQFRLAVETLERHGRVFEAKSYPGEPHGFRDPRNRIDMCQRSEAFFEKHLR